MKKFPNFIFFTFLFSFSFILAFSASTTRVNALCGFFDYYGTTCTDASNCPSSYVSGNSCYYNTCSCKQTQAWEWKCAYDESDAAKTICPDSECQVPQCYDLGWFPTCYKLPDGTTCSKGECKSGVCTEIVKLPSCPSDKCFPLGDTECSGERTYHECIQKYDAACSKNYYDWGSDSTCTDGQKCSVNGDVVGC